MAAAVSRNVGRHLRSISYYYYLSNAYKFNSILELNCFFEEKKIEFQIYLIRLGAIHNLKSHKSRVLTCYISITENRRDKKKNVNVNKNDVQLVCIGRYQIPEEDQPIRQSCIKQIMLDIRRES